MRICLLGDFMGNPDEGMKNVSKTIRDKLSLKHNILALNSRDVFKKGFVKSIRSFQPEIIHYLHGPTIRSLVLLEGLTIISGNKAKTISSATRPYFSKYSRWTIPLLKPDLILTQSSKSESVFKKMGCRVEFLPNGVDCVKFAPVNENEKLTLRRQFDLPENAIIVLHVGHIKPNRNLDVFKEIQKIENVQVVIVGGITETADERLKKDLQNIGVKVFHKLYDDISQFYKMADLYVFPLKDAGNKLPDSYNQVGAIDLPLSIFEAMACNLPVITTKFGALERLFESGGGFYYTENKEEIVNGVRSIFFQSDCNTRKKVLPYDWGKVVTRIESEYQSILQ